MESSVRSRLHSPTHLSSQGLQRPRCDWLYFPGNGRDTQGFFGVGARGPDSLGQWVSARAQDLGLSPRHCRQGRPSMFALSVSAQGSPRYGAATERRWRRKRGREAEWLPRGEPLTGARRQRGGSRVERTQEAGLLGLRTELAAPTSSL